MLQTVTNDNIDAREDSMKAENKEDSLGKEEQKVKFIHLRAKGYSFAKIAKELGVSKSTLSNWSQELEEQIAKAKAMELEALQEEYYILKEGRIKLLGEQLRAILIVGLYKEYGVGDGTEAFDKEFERQNLKMD